MTGRAPAGASGEIQRMQEGVQGWVEQVARRGKGGLRSASPAVLLSLLCASAFSPLLMATGVAGAGVSVLSAVGGGFLTQIISDTLDRLRHPGPAPSQQDLEKGIARQIQQALTAGDERANVLRAEIASVLKEIDAGGTALRAAMEQANEQVRSDVIDAISALGADFAEMGFLIKDVAQAAAEIQKSLDVQGANVRAIIEQNDRQSTDIRLVRENVAVLVERAGASRPTGAGRGDAVARWVRECPYRGLMPFGERDAEVFYGRERLAAELAVKLAARMARGGLVVVTGASGAGKSSLLRAGLLPILARGQQVQGSDQWPPPIVMTPTKDPLTELAARLAALGGADTVTIRDRLAHDPDQAHLAFWSTVLAATARQERHSAPDDSGARLVLIVDQFEQIFTLNPARDSTQQAFVTALSAAATNPVGPTQDPPALVVVAVRGDFWDRCADFPQLAGELQEGQFVVGPMTASELRMAITGPADAAGLRIDSALTDAILGDLRTAASEEGAGALPLLSQAMALTWEKREGDQLTSHGYGQAGGISHAVQTGADKVYDALPAGQQALARDLLRNMTITSRDGRLARRPVARHDLYTGLPGAARSDIDAVFDAFAAQRLIVLDGDTAQISHDVLLRAWPRLRGWLEEDQASWISYGQLTDAAAAWHDSHDDPSFLYRGAQLSGLQQNVTRWSANPARYPALTGTQRDFLKASWRAAARSRRLRRSLRAILATLTVLAVAASIVASLQRAAAIGQRDLAIYNQAISEGLQFTTSNTTLAAQIYLAAYRLRPGQDGASRLLNTENTPLSSSSLTSSTSSIDTVAFSPDGHTLASHDSTGTIRLEDVADPSHPRPLGQPLTTLGPVAANMVAFSRDGHTLAAAENGGTAQLWDVADPVHPGPLSLARTGLENIYITSVAFSPVDGILAGGEAGGDVQLWDVTDPSHPRLGQTLAISNNTYDVHSVAFSPDGRTLASDNEDGTIHLWDVTDPGHPRPLGSAMTVINAAQDVHSLAFSPYGHTLATGGGGTVQLWDVTDPGHPRPVGQALTVGKDTVNSVAFSSDGHSLATGDGGGQIRLWNVADPAHPRPLGQPVTSGGAAVNSVAFGPDGHILTSGNDDGTIRLWSLPQTVLTGDPSLVESVAFSRHGHLLATGDGGGKVRLWDVADPAHPRPLGQPITVGTRTTNVSSVALSPDGHTLVTGNDDGTVVLLNVADPEHPRPIGYFPTDNQGTIEPVAFSPDGHTLAAGFWYLYATTVLVDVADPAHPRFLGPSQANAKGGLFPAYSVAFGSDGRTLATGGAQNLIELWDVADPADPRGLSSLWGGSAAVNSVAFSPTGHLLASGDGDGTVRLWNVSDPAHPRPAAGHLLTGGGTAVNSVAFSPDGHTLATGDNGGTIRLWNVTDPAHPRPLGQPLNGGDTAVRSVAFSPDGQTLATGGDDGTIRLWDLNVNYAIERICATAGGLTPGQWNQYISQLGYQPLCVH